VETGSYLTAHTTTRSSGSNLRKQSRSSGAGIGAFSLPAWRKWDGISTPLSKLLYATLPT